MSRSTPTIPEPHDKDGLLSLLGLLSPSMTALDDFLHQQVEAFEPEVREIVSFCLARTGKRIRPLLLFLSGGEGSRVGDDLIRAAAVIEMVHLATLVHDDILDEADLRHGVPTVSRRYGPQTAVLLGDALFAQAVHLSTDFSDASVCRLVSAATRQVCSGEIAQTSRRGFTAISREFYFRLIQMKTAELFRVSCHLGAHLAGHRRDMVEGVARFGNHLGIAYQIYDDLADFFAFEEKAGKTLGTDWASGKVTLPLILFLEQLSPDERTDFIRQARQKEGLSFAETREMLEERDIFDAVAREILEHIRIAQQALLPFNGHAVPQGLRPLGNYLTEKVKSLRPALPVSEVS